MKARASTSRFREYGPILNLLQGWETVGRFKPGVQALLQEVSDRIESGTWLITGLNIFDILGCARKEDPHSDVLVWLFKPWESHGLGSRFLLDFVREGTGKSLPNSRVRAVTPRKPIGTRTGKVDIEVQGDGWVLAVEYKIDYSEGPGQTQRYAAYYRSLRQTGVKVFGVFLTLYRTPAEAGDIFKPMSYKQLHTILERNLARATSDGAQVVRWIADHILRDLET